jgi:hypothetical protein
LTSEPPATAKRARPGCFGVALIVVVLIVVYSIAHGSSSAGGSTADPAAKSACAHFRDVMADVRDGLLTNGELRSKVQEVYGQARASHTTGIASDANALLAAATAGGSSGIASAATAFGGTCAAAGQ